MKIKFFQKPGREAVRSTLLNACFWFLVLMYMETLLHGLLFDGFGSTYLYTVGFTAVFALVLSGLLGFLPRKANGIISLILVSVLGFLFCSQLVYDAVFGTMYSLSQVGMGGDAITNFWKETLATILDILPILLLMLLPIPVTALLFWKDKNLFTLGCNWLRLVVLVLAVVLQLTTIACLSIGGTGYYSTYYYYHSAESTTNQSAERFGFLSTMRLELFSNRSSESSSSSGFGTTDVQPTEPAATEDAAEETPRYNTLDIDFDYLNTLTEDEQLLELNSYVSSLSGTKTNEYTGMLADYNLITLCAESFATGAIREDLTPTLYKLATEGIVFNNYYNSYPNVTSDGEYSFCLGLWPDTTRAKAISSFYASRNSYLPFALGNVFTEQAGVTAYGYHNYLGSYYGRDETHPNMGYICKFADAGMTFTTDWPSSDLEMMEQSVWDYVNSGEQFHAYYMTFSGHYRYDRSLNPMADRNYEYVKDLGLSVYPRNYLACNYELEKALTYLMNALEEAGIADKTAIVLAGDHFPYGLNNEQYSELVGYELDSFSKFKSTLIFWVGGLDETIYVDDYMCNIDILPTILNLWGFSYDSRLLAGTDIFSDSQHIAVLRDQSFLTDEVWFNASTGEAIWQVDESTVDPGYLDSMIQLVKNQFTFSKYILDTAYYNFLFEKGNVVIDRYSWWNEVEDNN